MTETCDYCGRQVDRLIRMDDSYGSAAYSDLLEIPYESFKYMCASCAIKELGLSANDFSEEIAHQDSEQFLIDLLQGNIAQSIVKTILQRFNYDVYPYGYENYLSVVAKSLSSSYSNISARRIRSTPDLYVFDQKNKESYLVEVKTSTTKDESRCFIAKAKLDDYVAYWKEAFLVMYCLRSGNLYCQRVGDIERSKLEIDTTFNKKLYILNLPKDFFALPIIFKSLEVNVYTTICNNIQKVLNTFARA